MGARRRAYWGSAMVSSLHPLAPEGEMRIREGRYLKGMAPRSPNVFPLRDRREFVSEGNWQRAGGVEDCGFVLFVGWTWYEFGCAISREQATGAMVSS